MKLAGEAVEKPELLNVDLSEWLLSPSSQRSHVFFFWLGRGDEALIFRERIEALTQHHDAS
jgi:hypothetical protein